jgi:phosphoserine phosphatase
MNEHLLASWNDTATKKAIVEFVNRVTDEGSPDYVVPAARVAVFDNDGTLWCEKPMPIELGFILARFAEMAQKDEALREKQPWKAAYNKDYAWLGNVITKHYEGDDTDVKILLGAILAAFNGMRVDDYEDAAEQFLRSQQNPQLKRPYLKTAYVPMIELLDYLTANGFTNYIASGGDRDFMRPITDELYGIPSERVIGSSNSLAYMTDEAGSWIAYADKPDVFDDGPAKPVRIWSRIGRRPIFAAGNSNGDIPMMQFVEHASRPSLSVFVNHDDNEREIAYTAGAEKLLEAAPKKGWVNISVKEDWKTVFGEGKNN